MKYYIWILGCAMNISDAERISAVFDSWGFEKTENEKEADIYCVIACSVRQHAVDRIYGKIRNLKEREGVTTILSGCVLDADRKKLEKEFDLIFEMKEMNTLNQFLNRLECVIPTPSARDDKIEDYLSIVPAYHSKFRAYVPISTGCDNFCTYCAVPYTKGREKSRPMEDIVSEVKGLVKNGYKEITLLGQNVNSYGQDLAGKKDNSMFIKLVKEIDTIPGKYRVYFYSNHPKDMSDELIETLAQLKHFPHYVHLPLQSGSDEIIRKMNRHYTKEQYLNLVSKIRKAMPDVTLTTDIIVGFPGETAKDLEDTLDVVRESRFEMIFLAQFSPRPGTRAAKMIDNVPKTEKKKREEEVNNLLEVTLVKKNRTFVGTNQEILIDGEKGKRLFGRTIGFKVVELTKSPDIAIGDFVKVKNY